MMWGVFISYRYNTVKKKDIEVVFPLFIQVMPGLWLQIKFSFGWESVDFFRNEDNFQSFGNKFLGTSRNRRKIRVKLL